MHVALWIERVLMHWDLKQWTVPTRPRTRDGAVVASTGMSRGDADEISDAHSSLNHRMARRFEHIWMRWCPVEAREITGLGSVFSNTDTTRWFVRESGWLNALMVAEEKCGAGAWSFLNAGLKHWIRTAWLRDEFEGEEALSALFGSSERGETTTVPGAGIYTDSNKRSRIDSSETATVDVAYSLLELSRARDV